MPGYEKLQLASVSGHSTANPLDPPRATSCARASREDHHTFRTKARLPPRRRWWSSGPSRPIRQAFRNYGNRCIGSPTCPQGNGSRSIRSRWWHANDAGSHREFGQHPPITHRSLQRRHPSCHRGKQLQTHKRTRTLRKRQKSPDPALHDRQSRSLRPPRQTLPTIQKRPKSHPTSSLQRTDPAQDTRQTPCPKRFSSSCRSPL